MSADILTDEELLRAHESLTAELEEISELLRSTTKAHDEYEAELESERAAHEQTKARLVSYRTGSRAERAALTARIAELEADVERYSHGKLATRCAAAESALATAQARIAELEADWDSELVDKLNAQSALATARALLGTWLAWAGGDGPGFDGEKLERETDAFLSSIPAPVAAPCTGCAEKEAELDKQHAKLVELGDKLRIERNCAKVDSELIAAQKLRITALEQAIEAAVKELYSEDLLPLTRIDRALFALQAARKGET